MVSCNDIDECLDLEFPHNCDMNYANCTNTIGSYNCTCISGFAGDGTTCTNMMECDDGTHNCHVNAVCTDTVGSFECTCDSGFSGNGVECYDIDECEVNMGNCDNRTTYCNNTFGGFECLCLPGYFNPDGMSCQQLNECSDPSLNNCHDNAICTDIPGSYVCECLEGYEGNGTFCENIDECQNETLNNCDDNADCFDTDGSFNCTCREGYTGTGVDCQDIDECTSGTDDCHPDASCNNTVGSFNCTCLPGFEGNGTFCTDIDECVTGQHTCVNADCINTHGSFMCSACHPGFTGDGMPCRCSNGDIRLMNGSVHTSTLGIGRVEICYNNSYWAVCDDQWDIFDAGVVCRQLGFTFANSVPVRRGVYGVGVVPFLLDNVVCTGSESNLLQCTHDGLEEHNCDASETAGVICGVMTLEMEELAVEVNEGDRVARVCATMQGSADFPINVVFTTTADSAVAPGDYNSAPIVVEFPAKDNSPRCADVPIVDDQILEFTESFNMSLALSSPQHERIELGNTTETVVTIIDNDFVRVGFQQQDYSTIESAAEVTICAELEGALLRPVSVSLSTSNDSGRSAQAGVDYTPLTNVTLFAGTSSSPRQTECVEISLLHDSILENTEVIEVSLSSSDTAVRFSRPTTNIYILDDNGVRMGLMSREYTGSEGEEIEICVELVGMISQDIGLNIRTEPISAQADSDFASFSLPLVFHPLPGSIDNQRVCRNLSLLEDEIFEDQESLSVVMEVSHPRVSIHIGRATVFIQDNDEVSLSFLSPAATVSEDVGQVEACVELQGSTEVDIEYSVATLSASVQDTLDYRFTPSSSPFSFAPSTAPSQRNCHEIEIIDDDLLESSEHFSVQLSNNNVSRVSVVTEVMQVTIEDNDLVIVGLNRTEFLVLEEQVGGANISVCTVLRGKLQKNVTVVLITEASSADSSDFTGLNETLTFVPSVSTEQTICHTVKIHDDREVEGAEFFTIHLSSTESMVVLQPDSAVVTISEGDGMTTVQRNTSTIILLATIVPTLLALVVSTMLVIICACKKILKQNQFQEEDYYSVVGPPALPERNTPHKLDTHPNKDNQELNPAYGMNIMAMSAQGIWKSACDQRDSNAECHDTVLLSSNTAYSTDVSIAPEVGCEVNLAYEQRDTNAECRETMLLSSNAAYGTDVAIAPEIDCEVNLAYEQRDANVECHETMLLSSNAPYGIYQCGHSSRNRL